MSCIIHNRDGSTLLKGLTLISALDFELRIVIAFVSMIILMGLADTLERFANARTLFKDVASAHERRSILVYLRLGSVGDLRAERETFLNPPPLQSVEALFKAGHIIALGYTA